MRDLLQFSMIVVAVLLIWSIVWPHEHYNMWKWLWRKAKQAGGFLAAFWAVTTMSWVYVPVTERGRHRHKQKVDEAIRQAWDNLPAGVRGQLEDDREARAPRLSHLRPGEFLYVVPDPGRCTALLMLDGGAFHTQCSGRAGHDGDHHVTFTELRAANLHVAPF